MTRHLLVPMDDSELAREALEHALTAFVDADVTVVHVVDELEVAYGGGAPGVDAGSNPDFFEDVARIATEYGVEIETDVLGGAPADAIIAYAEAEAVDGIVMGSEGRSGVSRMLLGSVAEAVARRSLVPVTIVPKPDRESDDSPSSE